MLKYDVKIQLDDIKYAIHLDVYQRVMSEETCSDEEIIDQAKLQFRQWAEKQGEDWRIIASRIRFANVTDARIEIVK